jgi:hypothetical protein
MDTRKIIFIGGGIGLTYFLYKQFNNAVELGTSAIISPKNISVDLTHIVSPKLVIELQITNPTPNSVTINKIFGVVSFSGNQIGTINYNINQSINATSSTSVFVDMYISTLDLIKFFINVDFNQPIPILIKGYYVANQIQLPLLLDYSVPRIGKKKIKSNN